MNLSDYENRFFPMQKKVWGLYKQHPKFVKLIWGLRSGSTNFLFAAIKRAIKTTRATPISLVVPGHWESYEKSVFEEHGLTSSRLKMYDSVDLIPDEPHYVFFESFMWNRLSLERLYPRMISLAEEGNSVFAISAPHFESQLDIIIDGKGLEVVMPTQKMNPYVKIKDIKDKNATNIQIQRDYFCYGRELFQLNGEPIDACTN